MVPSGFVAYVSSSEVKIARFETIVGVYEPVEPEPVMTDTDVSPKEEGLELEGMVDRKIPECTKSSSQVQKRMGR